jgi:signal transduction histidine kinase
MDVAPLLTPDGTLVQFVLSFVDVTVNRQAKEAVRARDEFLTVAAHELRNPIASLRLAADIVVRDLRTDARVQPARLKAVSEVLAEQSTRVTRLVAQLLDLSRVDAGKLQLDSRTSLRLSRTSLRPPAVSQTSTRFAFMRQRDQSVR